MAKSLVAGLSALIRAPADAGFVKLVKASGLNPKTDFRHANLSGADLRDQDMRRFDLTNARFDGAIIDGAKFGPEVTPQQLASAIRSRRPGLGGRLAAWLQRKD